MSGLAGGAEAVVIPEVEVEPEELAARLRDSWDRGKPHAILVVAEGAPLGTTALLAYFEQNRARLGFQVRATILGHVQRGGMPGAFDRLLATRLGSAAADCLIRGEAGVLVGLRQGKIATTPLAEVAANKKALDLTPFELVRMMAI
jgi:6-phosphofructokinase 1